MRTHEILAVGFPLLLLLLPLILALVLRPWQPADFSSPLAPPAAASATTASATRAMSSAAGARALDYKLDVQASTAGVASALGDYLRTLSSASGGAFHVAVSGGSLPATLGKALKEAQPPIDVSQWEWWFADERCVVLGDKESNYAEAKKHVFDPLGVKADRIHPIDEAKIGNPAEVRTNTPHADTDADATIMLWLRWC